MCRKITISVLLVGILMLLLLGSGVKAKAATQSPRAPTTTPAPRKQVALNLYGTVFGGPGYVQTFALSDLINKYSPWVRASIFESMGSMQNVQMAAKKPELRSTSVWYAGTTQAEMLKEGYGPFKGMAHAGLRVVALSGINVLFLYTLNPKIKTEKDLIGKKIATHRAGGLAQVMSEWIFQYGMDLPLDRFNIQLLDLVEGKNAIADGLIDVATSMVVQDEKGNYIPSTPLQELMLTRNVYFVSIDPETIRKAGKRSGFTMVPATMPAGALGPKQPQPVSGYITAMAFYVDASMPEDVAYEVTRIFYEYADKFGDYGTPGKAIIRETLPLVPCREADFHPGALKLYKQKGVKEIGMVR